MTVQELLKKSWSLRRNVVDIIMAGDVSYGALVTSLAWGLNGQVNYVLEGNLNYTGAVITWLKEGVSLIASDGGPTANKYLMQFQSDIAQVTVSVSDVAELSGFGAACAAGFSCGLYDPETIFANTHRSCFTPEMDNTEREARYNGWQKAVRQALTH
ncbi:hypothetical protein [Hominenteromicrobium sp.]|uniref:hypothetical protein n=1 Tax=Hominenteromicrobium sp. TaxID=3073581 RepID=UPI003A8FD8C2